MTSTQIPGLTQNLSFEQTNAKAIDRFFNAKNQTTTVMISGKPQQGTPEITIEELLYNTQSQLMRRAEVTFKNEV